jgi:membrane protein DedA with SNARE-associated domain
MFEEAIHWLVTTIHQFGYTGLFVLGFLEILPIPKELVIIPSGYLVHQGKMSLVGVMLANGLGTTAGACFNYWLVRRFGRPFVDRFGRYMFINETKMLILEQFFARHGSLSIFLGRLIPGLRHYLFLPAGLARMSALHYTIYTAAGIFIWTGVLVMLGYYIGENQELALQYLPLIKLATVGAIAVVVGAYIFVARRKARRA